MRVLTILHAVKAHPETSVKLRLTLKSLTRLLQPGGQVSSFSFLFFSLLETVDLTTEFRSPLPCLSSR
jgi:hypothetical protein